MRDYDTQMAWAAGFFKGEGSVTRQSRRPVAQIRNNDPETLRFFRLSVEAGKIYGPYVDRSRRSRRPFWHWIATGHEVLVVVRGLAPWLSDRRLGQIQDMLAGVGGSTEPLADALYPWVRALRGMEWPGEAAVQWPGCVPEL
jgi:hypothetical protein